jgi:LPS-assembly lipoprotein
MVRLVAAISVLALTASMSGCGFHLRGMGSDQSAIDEIHVSATNAHGEMEQQLERSLTEAGVRLVDAGKAPWSLRLLTERHTRRAVATTSDVKVAEYELRFEVGFQLTDSAGKAVIPGATVFAERIYRFDSASLVGNSAEETLLDQEMRRDVASQIIRRINASVRSAQGKAQ